MIFYSKSLMTLALFRCVAPVKNEQYYYHYELGEGKNRVKRSVYIPKSKLDVVQE